MIRTLPDFSLGWELEACRRASRVPKGVDACHDGSVDGDGMEYKVSRNLVSNISENLRALRDITTDRNVLVNQTCGFHVHMGLGRRTRQAGAWAAWFVQLARMVESEAFAAVPPSRRENRFCRSWKQDKNSILERTYPREKYSNSDNRYYWVNVVEMFRPTGIRTVEIRLLGATRRYTYTLAWISACRIMAASAWILLFDPSRLEQEADELKKVFHLIRETYVNSPDDRKKAAKTALYLAEKARLLSPVGTPLRQIAAEEIEVARQQNVSEAEAMEFENLLREMRVAAEARVTADVERRASIARGVHRGDRVMCTVVPDDGGMTVGRVYEVYDVGPAHNSRMQDNQDIRVYNNSGDLWHIGVGRVELHERNGERVMSEERARQIMHGENLVPVGGR